MTTQTRVSRGVPAGGQFAATSHGEPELSLGNTSFPPRASSQEIFAEVFHAAAGDAEIVREFPSNSTETKRLLKNTRGANDGRVRQVTIGHGVIPRSDEAEVHGPKDGRPILIEVYSGMVRLKVMSGRAIVQSNSSWGNVIEVAGGAEATVIAEGNSKVTMTVASGGVANFHSTLQSHRMHAFVEEGGTCNVKLPGEDLKAYVNEFDALTVSVGAPVDSPDEDDDSDDKCGCGASLDDGEGWDGKCGDCADVAEVENCTQIQGCDSPGHVDGCPEDN